MSSAVTSDLPEFVSTLSAWHGSPSDDKADPFGPIVYRDAMPRTVARVVIHWEEGPADVEEYRSLTQAMRRYSNIRYLIDAGLSYHIRDVRLEVTG